MKHYLIVALFIGASGSYGYQLWQASIENAYTAAYSSAMLSSKVAQSKLKAKYERKLDQQAQKYSRKLKKEREEFERKTSNLERKHKKDVAKVKHQGRIRSRTQRSLALLPLVGVAANAWLEKKEYEEWKLDNPNKSLKEYTQQTALETKEHLNELITEFKEDQKTLSISLKSTFDKSG